MVFSIGGFALFTEDHREFSNYLKWLSKKGVFYIEIITLVKPTLRLLVQLGRNNPALF